MNRMHPLLALLLLHRIFSQMRQPAGGGSMPSLAATSKAMPQQRATGQARAQGHHGRTQGFQGEKGPIAAARARATAPKSVRKPQPAQPQAATQPGQIPSLTALLSLLGGQAR